MPNFFQARYDFSWVQTALEAYVRIEEAQVKQATVRQMTREIIAICQNNRARVVKVEAFLDEFQHVLSHEHKQDIFRLIAETLLFIQYRGVRIKCSEDPYQLIGRA